MTFVTHHGIHNPFMTPMIAMLFQTPGLLSILCHQRIYPMKEPFTQTETVLLETSTEELVNIKWTERKNPKGLSVEVNIPYRDIDDQYNNAIKAAKKEEMENEFNYYKTYLRQIIPGEEHRYDDILSNFKALRNKVKYRMDNSYTDEVNMIDRLVRRNDYISKNTRRPGLVVKMFHTWYYGQDAFVKVYLYDSNCQSYRLSIRENFMNEVIFQSYAKKLNAQLDFISPEVYSWGKIRRFVLGDSKYPYECLFIIMEYIPFVTLKEAVYTTEHMRHIYERVEQIDTELSSHLLHHNDLHGGNIMVSPTSSPYPVGDKSPYPEIVILDFGEASLGPTKTIFKRGIHK